MRNDGMLLTFEGIEGAGKTTQAALLARALRASGRVVTVTREPGGGGKVGSTLRRLLKDPEVWRSLELAEIYLYAAARAHHLESLILPAIARGEIVICDRYLDSTRAYQGSGRGRSAELIEELHLLPPLDTRPLRTLLLDLTPRVGLERAAEREIGEEAGYDDESHAFFEKVRRGFEAIAEREPERVRLIEASGEQLEVHRRIVDRLLDLFPRLVPVDALGD